MHASEVTREVIERANDLYWGSDRSVNQIADDLELSKGALYGIIEPEGSGLGCPLCGDEVVWANRTAKDRNMLDCPTCEWEGGPEEAMEEHDGPSHDSRAREPTGAASSAESSRDSRGTGAARHEAGDLDDDGNLPEPVLPPPPTRPMATTIAGGALLGAAVGLALVMWARRR